MITFRVLQKLKGNKKPNFKFSRSITQAIQCRSSRDQLARSQLFIFQQSLWIKSFFNLRIGCFLTFILLSEFSTSNWLFLNFPVLKKCLASSLPEPKLFFKSSFWKEIMKKILPTSQMKMSYTHFGKLRDFDFGKTQKDQFSFFFAFAKKNLCL